MYWNCFNQICYLVLENGQKLSLVWLWYTVVDQPHDSWTIVCSQTCCFVIYSHQHVQQTSKWLQIIVTTAHAVFQISANIYICQCTFMDFIQPSYFTCRVSKKHSSYLSVQFQYHGYLQQQQCSDLILLAVTHYRNRFIYFWLNKQVQCKNEILCLLLFQLSSQHVFQNCLQEKPSFKRIPI